MRRPLSIRTMRGSPARQARRTYRRMIANARMYSVDSESCRALAAGYWRRSSITRAWTSSCSSTPNPRRSMSCGNAPTRPPCSCAACPSLCPIRGQNSSPRRFPRRRSSAACRNTGAKWWSGKTAHSMTVEQTLWRADCFTVPDSQSGCLAALHYLMTAAIKFPLYREVVVPQVTPLGAVSAVIGGSADVAPIDSYAFCLLQKYRPELTSATAHRRPHRADSRSRRWWRRGQASNAFRMCSWKPIESRHCSLDGGVVAGAVRASGAGFL